jgi:hypothetical protein
MGPQYESGITHKTGASEGHSRHRHINDHLDEGVRRRLDQLGKARMQLACGCSANLACEFERNLARRHGSLAQ